MSQLLAAVHHPTTPPAPQFRVHMHRRPGIKHALPAAGSAAGQSPSVGPVPPPGIVLVGPLGPRTFVGGEPESSAAVVPEVVAALLLPESLCVPPSAS